MPLIIFPLNCILSPMMQMNIRNKFYFIHEKFEKSTGRIHLTQKATERETLLYLLESNFRSAAIHGIMF